MSGGERGERERLVVGSLLGGVGGRECAVALADVLDLAGVVRERPAVDAACIDLYGQQPGHARPLSEAGDRRCDRGGRTDDLEPGQPIGHAVQRLDECVDAVGGP